MMRVALSSVETLSKAHVRAHFRRGKDGKPIFVREHEDSRQENANPAPLARWQKMLREAYQAKEQQLAERANLFGSMTPELLEKVGSRFYYNHLYRQFGVKAVAFGDWLENPKGEIEVGSVGKALFDISTAIGFSPSDVSLNGRLRVLFDGNPDQDWRGQYHATREHQMRIGVHVRGGTIGHEWAHFLDHVIAEVSGLKAPQRVLATNILVSGNVQPRVVKGSPILTAMTAIIDLCYTDPIENGKQGKSLVEISADADERRKERAKERRAKEDPLFDPDDDPLYYHYYQQPHEMFARAFEAYLNDRLQGQDARYSPALKDTTTSGELYPQGEYRKQFNERFDRLFDALRADDFFCKAVVMIDALEKASVEHHWIEAAKKHFGVTTDPAKAGYVTPSGEMLDFSDHKRHKTVEHGEIARVIGAGKSPIDFVKETGSVRYGHYPERFHTWVDMAHPLTRSQKNTIARNFQGGTLDLDLNHPRSGELVSSRRSPDMEPHEIDDWLDHASNQARQFKSLGKVAVLWKGLYKSTDGDTHERIREGMSKSGYSYHRPKEFAALTDAPHTHNSGWMDKTGGIFKVHDHARSAMDGLDHAGVYHGDYDSNALARMHQHGFVRFGADHSRTGRDMYAEVRHPITHQQLAAIRRVHSETDHSPLHWDVGGNLMDSGHGMADFENALRKHGMHPEQQKGMGPVAVLWKAMDSKGRPYVHPDDIALAGEHIKSGHGRPLSVSLESGNHSDPSTRFAFDDGLTETTHVADHGPLAGLQSHFGVPKHLQTGPKLKPVSVQGSSSSGEELIEPEHLQQLSDIARQHHKAGRHIRTIDVSSPHSLDSHQEDRLKAFIQFHPSRNYDNRNPSMQYGLTENGEWKRRKSVGMEQHGNGTRGKHKTFDHPEKALPDNWEHPYNAEHFPGSPHEKFIPGHGTYKIQPRNGKYNLSFQSFDNKTGSRKEDLGTHDTYAGAVNTARGHYMATVPGRVRGKEKGTYIKALEGVQIAVVVKAVLPTAHECKCKGNDHSACERQEIHIAGANGKKHKAMMCSCGTITFKDDATHAAHASGKDVLDGDLEKGIPPEHLSKSIDGKRYSTTQLNLSEKDAKLIQEWVKEHVDPADLVDKDSGYPHITVFYGLETDNAGPVRHLVEGFGTVRVRVGKASLFEAPEYDVLKLDIDSQKIRDLHTFLLRLPHQETHPYSPHLTLAYLKKGTGKKYVGDGPLTGKMLKFSSLVFSDLNRNMTAIPLDNLDGNFRKSVVAVR